MVVSIAWCVDPVKRSIDGVDAAVMDTYVKSAVAACPQEVANAVGTLTPYETSWAADVGPLLGAYRLAASLMLGATGDGFVNVCPQVMEAHHCGGQRYVVWARRGLDDGPALVGSGQLRRCLKPVVVMRFGPGGGLSVIDYAEIKRVVRVQGDGTVRLAFGPMCSMCARTRDELQKEKRLQLSACPCGRADVCSLTCSVLHWMATGCTERSSLPLAACASPRDPNVLAAAQRGSRSWR